MSQLLCLVVFLTFVTSGFSLMCYQCSPAVPGCNSPFNWRGMGYLGTVCPEEDDRCVKIIERKGSEEMITRNCLSNLSPVRTDVPADHYEGCRPASMDIRLSHYVNNSIKEYDVNRQHYDSTTWCFCFLDHRCNDSNAIAASVTLILITTGYLIRNFFY